MTIHLPEDLEHFVRAEVLNGHFASEDDLVAAALREFLRQRAQSQAELEQSSAHQETPTAARKPIWERILERTASVPEEEWDKVPSDLAEQHDHYIYGMPKRPTA